jgi:hypothetical protein
LNEAVKKDEDLFFVDVGEALVFCFSASFDDGNSTQVLHSVEDGDMPVGLGLG